MVRLFLRTIKKNFLLIYYKILWRKRNKNNFTSINLSVPCSIVDVGNYTYGKLNVHYYKTDFEHLSIGSFCSIADNVHFFLAGGHDYRNISTFPLRNYLYHDHVKESTSKGPIFVEDDVWIGYGAVIMSGVRIGKGSVIGANSIVTKDVPPYSIYAGTKVIKKRFSDDVIEKLLDFDFSSLSLDDCKDKIDYFYTNLTDDNIDDIISNISK